MRRFKTGTPPRVNRRSVDVSKMELQPGDAHPEPFSFSTTGEVQNQAVCYLTYTNEETHRIIRSCVYETGYKTRGDQFVNVVVETPTKLTKEQKELLRKLENGGEDTQPKKKGFFEKLKEDME